MNEPEQKPSTYASRVFRKHKPIVERLRLYPHPTSSLKELLEAAASRIEELESSVPESGPKWTPCSERLPTTNGDYLCRVGSAHRPIRVLEFSPSEIQPSKPWRNGDDGRPYAHFITHWMELPSGPDAT